MGNELIKHEGLSSISLIKTLPTQLGFTVHGKLHLIYHPIAKLTYHLLQINRTITFMESTTKSDLGCVLKAEIH